MASYVQYGINTETLQNTIFLSFAFIYTHFKPEVEKIVFTWSSAAFMDTVNNIVTEFYCHGAMVS